MEICQKMLTLTPRLLSSLKVSGTDTDQYASCGFLLVFHSSCIPLL